MLHSSCGLRLGTSFVTTFTELVKTDSFHSSYLLHKTLHLTILSKVYFYHFPYLTSLHWMKVTGLLWLLDSGGDLSVKTFLLLFFLDNTASTTNFQGNLLTFSVWPRLAPAVMFDKLYEKKLHGRPFKNIFSAAELLLDL